MHYENGVILRKKSLSLKCCQSFELEVYLVRVQIIPKRYCGSLQVGGLQSCSLSNFENYTTVQDPILVLPACGAWWAKRQNLFRSLTLQLVVLHAFDLKRPTVSLPKALNPLEYVFPFHKIGTLKCLINVRRTFIDFRVFPNRTFLLETVRLLI